MPGLIATCWNVATAFPLPSTATPEEPPAVPATPGKAAAALHVPPDRTEYLTPPLMSHTATAGAVTTESNIRLSLTINAGGPDGDGSAPSSRGVPSYGYDGA